MQSPDPEIYLARYERLITYETYQWRDFNDVGIVLLMNCANATYLELCELGYQMEADNIYMSILENHALNFGNV